MPPAQPARARAIAIAATVALLSVIALGACPKKTVNPTLPDGGVDRGPVIDSHTLIAPLDVSIDAALQLFERVGVVKFCNKNGGYLGGRAFAATLKIKHRLKDRFEFFANVRWRGVNEPGWGKREADRLEEEVRVGAKGVKIFKALGLGVLDASGALMHIDDERLIPFFERAAKLNAIVAMHTGDPKAFFEPPTPDNERYEELREAPDWSFYGDEFPSRAELFAQRERLIARHPDVTFLLIHVANNPEDLDFVTRLLDKHPNVYVDTSARVPEIGRHPPDKVRAFFVRFQDRILFGTDLALSPYNIQLGSVSKKAPTFEDAIEFYQRHYRFFETNLRQIDHPTPIQGNWKIDAIGLPYPVLRKLYYDNAEKLIFQRKMTVPVIDPLDEQTSSAPPVTP